jgi:hypothetical protein
MPVSVITGTDYAAIASYYGDVKTKLGTIAGSLFNAVYQIVLMNTYEPTKDLIDVFSSVYEVSGVQFASLIPFVPAVKAINTHVLNRGGYASVSAFLTAKGVTVPQAWADLCAASGTTIDPSRISG